MCGRFALSTPMDQFALAMEAEPLSDLTSFEPSWNVAPQSLIPVATEVGQDGTGEVNRQFRLMRWGFRPSWAKASNREPINARSETMHDKPMFQSAAEHRRGVVPVDGLRCLMRAIEARAPGGGCHPRPGQHRPRCRRARLGRRRRVASSQSTR